MSVSIELLAIKHPNRNPSFGYGVVKRKSFASPSLRFDSRGHGVSIVASRVKVAAKGLGVGFLLPERRSTVVSAASHEESSQEIEIEEESEDHKARSKESEEALEQTLAAFKEQAIKMQSVSQEAYEIYSKRAIAVLGETSKQLKIEAEKARLGLTVVAEEITKESREYLSKATENTPEVKEILETFSSPSDEVKEISKLRDFYLGIPYGLLLTLAGFLSFMVTGSISAVRFGIILGGTLLALSVASLKAHKKGKTSHLALKGQAAIATIILLRELRISSQRLTFPNLLITIVSGAMVAFYLYRITVDGKWSKGSSMEYGTEN